MRIGSQSAVSSEPLQAVLMGSKYELFGRRLPSGIYRNHRMKCGATVDVEYNTEIGFQFYVHKFMHVILYGSVHISMFKFLSVLAVLVARLLL